MTKLKVTCNCCSTEIRSGGLSVSISAGADEVGIDIKKGIDTAWEDHYCGKGCLIKSLDVLVDRINGTVVLEHETAPVRN